MADSVTWTGKSGLRYTYYVHEIGTSMKDLDGNYIYAKKNSNDKWVPVYIGQGNLQTRSNLDIHHKGSCIRSKNATHFLCHVNSKESDRLAEESDLLESYSIAYMPAGCNEQ